MRYLRFSRRSLQARNLKETYQRKDKRTLLSLRMKQYILLEFRKYLPTCTKSSRNRVLIHRGKEFLSSEASKWVLLSFQPPIYEITKVTPI